METKRNIHYRIEPKRDGIFQLWTPEDAAGTSQTTLVIMFGFYHAPEKIIALFCDIYFRRRLCVLYVPSSMKRLIWPNSAVKLGKKLMDYLNEEASGFSNFIIHTISMGSYEFLVCNYSVIAGEPEKYCHVRSKIKAVIYDSSPLGNTEHWERAIITAGKLMTKSRMLQVLIPWIISIYSCVMHNITMKYFAQLTEKFRTDPLEVPTLYIYSENDPLLDYKFIQEMIKRFRKKGMFPVLDLFWKESRHSFHLMLHADEYLAHITRLLEFIPEQNGQNLKLVRSKM